MACIIFLDLFLLYTHVQGSILTREMLEKFLFKVKVMTGNFMIWRRAQIFGYHMAYMTFRWQKN